MKSLGLFFLLMLVLASPSAGYEVSTHQKLFNEALLVLAGDGYQSLSDMFKDKNLIQCIELGLSDADLVPTDITDEIHWDHGMDPWMHWGFSFDFKKPSAGETVRTLFWQAVNSWNKGSVEGAYKLGLALHRLEDVTFCGHSRVDIWNDLTFTLVDWDWKYPAQGHTGYEVYAQSWLENFSEEGLIQSGFLVNQGGIYNFSSFTKDGVVHCDSGDPFGWVDYAAHQSYDWLEPLKNAESGSDAWQEITKKQFILCQKVVAGFLVFFQRAVALNEMSLIPVSQQKPAGWLMLDANAGHTNEISYPARKPEKILWSKDRVMGLPVVSKEGVVYLLWREQGLGIFAALKSNGQELWRYKLGWRIYSAPATSPAIDSQGNIYFYADGIFYCFSPKGEKRWEKEVVIQNNISLVIDADDHIIVATNNSIWSFSLQGDSLWCADIKAEVTPAIGLDGTTVYGVNSKTYFSPSVDEGIFALDAKDGTIRWRFKRSGISKIIVTANAVYAITLGNLWTPFYVGCLDLKGNFLWESTIIFATGNGCDGFTAPANEANKFYFIFHSGAPSQGALAKYSWDLAQPRDKWSQWLFTGEKVDFFGTPVIDAQDIIYVASEDCRIYALDAAQGKVLWKFFPEEKMNGWVSEPPQIVIGPDGTFYIAVTTGIFSTTTTLFALGSTNPEAPAWQDLVEARQPEPIVFKSLGVAVLVNSQSESSISVRTIDADTYCYQLESKVPADSLVSIDLAVSYDEKILAQRNISEERATLAFSEDNGVTWQLAATVRDTAKKVLYAFGLTHLSLWTIVEGEEENATTAVPEISSASALPQTFHLAQNYPNPFNQGTVIRFDLFKESIIALNIYDVLGQKVFALASGKFPAGSHQILWDAKDLPSGIYFYSLKVGEKIETKKAILLR